MYAFFIYIAFLFFSLFFLPSSICKKNSPLFSLPTLYFSAVNNFRALEKMDYVINYVIIFLFLFLFLILIVF